MQVGCFGDIAFEVSDQTIKTISNFSIKGSANYATHSRIGNTDLVEMTGIGAKTISFEMVISSYLGCDPHSEVKKINSYMEQGRVGRMVIGDDYFGRFVIQNYTQKASNYDPKNGVTVCTVSVSLLEYTED